MNIKEKLTTIADNVPKIYNNGYNTGKSEVLTEANALNDQLEEIIYGAGTDGKSFYDEFWDAVQQNGSRIYYKYGFAGYSWNEKTFYPKYDMRPIQSVSCMFQEMYVNTHNGYNSFSLNERLKECGVVLDFSGMNKVTASNVFYATAFTEISNIDFTWATKLDNTFSLSTYLETVSFTLNTEGSTNFNTPFNRCINLINLTIGGTIGQDGFSVKDSPLLTRASITSIINALSDTTSGLTATLSLAAVNKAFQTIEAENDGSMSSEWLALVATKPNWTISLA